MPEFVLLFVGGNQPSAPAEMQQHMEKWGAWIKSLRDKGLYKEGQPLEPKGKGIRGEKKIVTDGPFAEAKDLVGGFVVVLADDLDQAVEIAKGCPTLDINGAVEVRPVMKLSMLRSARARARGS